MKVLQMEAMKAIVRANNWRIDTDGFLRVTMRVLKKGVYDYAPKEHGEEIAARFKDKAVIREFIDSKNFTDQALKTLEGKPIIIQGHEWRDLDNTLTDGLTVGNIAGTPYVEGDGIIADGIISNAKVIELISNKGLVEVSAGYETDLDTEHGTEEYDAAQGEPRFNHVLLIPEGKGRCGQDVRILNTKSAKETQMKVKIKNAKGVERVYEFSNEKDAETAETVARDVQDSAEADKTEAVDGKDKEVKAANHDLETAKAELETLKAKCKDLEARIEQFASEEYQEGVTKERGEYKEDEEAVMNAEVPEEEKAGIKEKLGNCKSVIERRKTLTVAVMNTKGVDLSAASDDAVSASFRTLVTFAKGKTASKGEAKAPQVKAQNTKPNDFVHPVFQRG